MNHDDLRGFATKVHNVRTEFLRRLGNDLTLAGNDHLEAAEEGFLKELQILDQLEGIQKLETRFFPSLKKIILRELDFERELSSALAKFVHSADRKKREQVYGHIRSAFNDLERYFQEEDKALSKALDDELNYLDDKKIA